MMTDNVTTIADYFDRLRSAFAGSDPAMAQDATYDAQEFLAGERLTWESEGGDPNDETELLRRLIEEFGHPDEVVEGYRQTERQVAAALAQPSVRPNAMAAGHVLSVFFDPRSYGALFHMLISLPLGILSFTWAVTGVSLSLGLSILIFGFFFFLFFMSTVRAVALMECRIVETLLGERMPRRPARVPPSGSWGQRILFWIKDGRTWLTILYMLVRLPLGILYFVIATTLLVLALSLFVAPFAQLFLDFPILHIFGQRYDIPFGLFPFFWLASAFDLLVLMHVARGLGRWHARIAKNLLVRPGA